MSFENLLIQTCDIQSKTLSNSNYEQTETWANESTNIPCRKNSNNSPKINDGNIRINTDDDLFFFKKDAVISRGKRIVFDGENYDVIKVNKLYDAKELHHLEVIARFIDHK